MKLKKQIILLLLLMIIPLNVEAYISMSCPGPAKKGSLVKCKITSSSGPITSFSSTIILDTDETILYHGALPLEEFKSTTDGRLLRFTAEEGGTTIAEVHFFVNNNNQSRDFTLILSDIKYMKDETEFTQENLAVVTNIEQIITTEPPKVTTTEAPVEKTFTVSINNNNGTTGAASQSCTTTGANCKIDLTRVGIPSRAGHTFNGWGSAPSCTEGNKTSYTATSNTTLYACWLSDAQTPDNQNIYLQSLLIQGQELGFSKFIQDYELKVLYEVEELAIMATPATADIKVELEESYPLEVGENTIEIKLTNNSGGSNVYTIKVTRLEEGETIKEPSNDATIKSLDLGEYEIDFRPNVFEYQITVSPKTTNIPIAVILNDDNAEYIISGEDNIIDGGIIKITVKAEDGTFNVYNIHINHAKGVLEYAIFIGLGVVLLAGIIVLIMINQPKKDKKSKKEKKIKTKAPKIKKQSKKGASKPTTEKEVTEVLDI